MSWYADFVDTFYKCFIKDDRYKFLIDGIGVTIKVSLLAVAIGILIGLVIALCNLSKNKFLNAIGKVYTDVIRGTPSVTQLMIIYFVVFATVNWEKWIIASIAFGINSGAYVAEIVRGGIMSIDVGQTEAGRSLGFNYMQTMWHIVFPQAFKAVLPALANEFVVLLKETSIAFYIGLGDLMYSVNAIRAATYSAFMPLVAAAVIYLIMVLVLSKLVSILERRLRNSER